jgi:hypothetical protein
VKRLTALVMNAERNLARLGDVLEQQNSESGLAEKDRRIEELLSENKRMANRDTWLATEGMQMLATGGKSLQKYRFLWENHVAPSKKARHTHWRRLTR